MPLPKSEYVSDIWKDGVFGNIPSIVNSAPLTWIMKITKSSSALAEEERYAAHKSGHWST